MTILIDINLSPQWREVLSESGIPSIHWSEIGVPSAPDTEILAKAASEGWTVLTHDLDFGILLYVGLLSSPSVIQLRSQEVSPAVAGPWVLEAVSTFAQELSTGALVTIDESKTRVRVLPFRAK